MNETFIKTCKNQFEFEKEIYIYKKNLSFTPKLVMADFPELTLTKIGTTTIGEMNEPDFFALSRLFISFHELERKGNLTLCHWDCNPKNYLWDQDTNVYFMIDFSSWCYDFPITDLIKFMLFWASIYKKEKFEHVCSSFLNSYDYKISITNGKIEELFINLVDEFDTRRKTLNKIERNQNTDVKYNRKYLLKNMLSFYKIN